MVTNINKLIILTFDKNVNCQKTIADHAGAFLIEYTDRKYFRDTTTVFHSVPATSLAYAVDSTGAIVKNKLVLTMNDTDNFRSAEGPVTIRYTATTGLMYADLMLDVLKPFTISFVPTGIDHMRNPDAIEVCKQKLTDATSFTLVNLISAYRFAPVEVCTQKLNDNSVFTLTLVGQIKP